MHEISFDQQCFKLDASCLMLHSRPAELFQREGRVSDQKALAGVVDAEVLLEETGSGSRVLGSAMCASALAEATRVLLESLDYEQTLFQIGSIALRTMADWCMVDVIQSDGTFDRVIVLHRNSKMNPFAEEMKRDFKPHFEARGVVSRVLRTGKPLLIPTVTDAHYAATSRSKRHEELLRTLGSESYMCLPLMTRGRFLGAVTLVSSDKSHRYGAEDVSFAEELCARAALAVDNALLHRQAKDAIQLRDDLINIVSHDLKNPLSAIQMATHMLLRMCGSIQAPEKTSDRIHKSIESIQHCSGRMKSLISDLLDLSKVGSGAILLEKKMHSIHSILSEVLEVLAPISLERDIQIKIDIPEYLELYCDSERISQVLTNLISNAIKFSPHSGSVRIWSREAKDKTWILVQDFGAGIPSEDLGHVFDRFWQAKSTKRSGTGLGLSIVKGFVEAHGGEVWVESVVGKGSSFSFSIPDSFGSSTKDMYIGGS